MVKDVLVDEGLGGEASGHLGRWMRRNELILEEGP